MFFNLAWFNKLSFGGTGRGRGVCGSSKILRKNWMSTVNFGAVHLGWELFWRENDFWFGWFGWKETRTLTSSAAVGCRRRSLSRSSLDRLHWGRDTLRWSLWGTKCVASFGRLPRSGYAASSCAAALQVRLPVSFEQLSSRNSRAPASGALSSSPHCWSAASLRSPLTTQRTTIASDPSRLWHLCHPWFCRLTSIATDVMRRCSLSTRTLDVSGQH